MHYSQIYFGKELYMFRRDLPSIIMSLNTVYMQQVFVSDLASIQPTRLSSPIAVYIVLRLL